MGGGLRGYLGRLGAAIALVDHVVSEHFLTGDAEHDLHLRVGLLVPF